MQINYEPIARRCDFSARVALVLLAICLPLTTSGSEMLAGFIVVMWLATGRYRERLELMFSNRIAVLSLALFGLFSCGISYGSASGREALHGLMKYRELLLLPVLLTLFQRPHWEWYDKNWEERWFVRWYCRHDPSGVAWRQWGVWCIVLGTLVAVAGSYVEWFVGRDIGFVAINDNVVFKDRIIQSLFVAFAVYFLAYRALESRRWWWAYSAAIGVSLFSLFALVPGRTGYLVLAALVSLLMWQRFRWRGLAVATAAVMLLVGGAFAGSSMFRARMQQSMAQVQQYFSGDAMGAGAAASVEPRLKYYEMTWQLIRRSPIVGLGTGGFVRGYRDLPNPEGLPVPAEPHNEYLAIASQIGLIGLAVWLWLLIAQWKAAQRLALPERHFAQALLVLMSIGCLANSLLLGYTGGMLYAYLTALLYAGQLDSTSAIASDSSEPSTLSHPALRAIAPTDALRPAA
ncbi:MAG: O-antigen ligase family protein [Planctomycetales bacterium]|nr:O-antigen ligase family protein [Planctomycetales bacterium]